jgi:hypothetical protein
MEIDEGDDNADSANLADEELPTYSKEDLQAMRVDDLKRDINVLETERNKSVCLYFSYIAISLLFRLLHAVCVASDKQTEEQCQHECLAGLFAKRREL